MATNGIGPLSSQPHGPQSGVSSADRAERAAADGAGGALDARSSGDRVEVSSEAKALAQATTEAEQLEEVRPEVVEAAKRMLASGFYNDRGVLESTAGEVAPFVDLDG